MRTGVDADPFSLHGRLALVTGGNGGLGLATARALESAGASVVVTGRDVEKNAEASKEFTVLPLDVTDPEDVARLFRQLWEERSGVDILVNNAGVYLDDTVAAPDTSAWDRMIAVNLTGTLRCSREAARQMSRKAAGKIINVGSVYSAFGHPNSSGYAASKAGVVGLTKSLAAELGSAGIQVNAVLPGWFPTEINGDLPGQPRGDEIRRRTPANRWGETPDIGGAVVFLAAPASDFVTGTALPVDGGYSVTDRFIHL